MTIATTTSPAGSDWTNVLGDNVVRNFLFNQTAAPTLSANTLDITYTFGPASIFFHSPLGCGLNPRSGTINGVDTPDTQLTGLAVTLQSFADAIRDGDTDALNKLIWSSSDTITGAASTDFLRGFAGNDLIFGNDGDDRLFGDQGSDKLHGGNGNDMLVGGAGSDQLFGDAGDDSLAGGAGNDRITGGAGLDLATGGAGADKFIFTALGDFAPYTQAARIPYDAILGFSHTEGDLIDLKQIDANATLGGNQAFTFIGTADFTPNTPGTLHVKTTSDAHSFLVQLNTDSDVQPEATFLVVTTDGVAPVAADFIL